MLFIFIHTIYLFKIINQNILYMNNSFTENDMFIEKLFSRTKNRKNKPTILKFTEFNAQQKKVLDKEHKKLEVFKRQRDNS